mmetsp:Transcript_113508/g.317063  ORF Transcript_113508/g.317063 Transcript_113508/m.317063 type:complete len:206 (+) Transcript_113508:373-990(+)
MQQCPRAACRAKNSCASSSGASEEADGDNQTAASGATPASALPDASAAPAAGCAEAPGAAGVGNSGDGESVMSGSARRRTAALAFHASCNAMLAMATGSTSSGASVTLLEVAAAATAATENGCPPRHSAAASMRKRSCRKYEAQVRLSSPRRLRNWTSKFCSRRLSSRQITSKAVWAHSLQVAACSFSSVSRFCLQKLSAILSWK